MVRALKNARWMLKGLLAAAVVLCLVCCRATTTTQREHTTQTHNADTMATEAKHDGHSHQQSVNLDSIVSVVWQRTLEEFARQEQEHEITTETLTETIDSLGRVVRQSQKTTDRTTSRQEQQRIENLQQTMQQQISRAVSSQDSVWQERFSRYQASIRDSLDTDKQKITEAAQPLTWWQKTWAWLRGVLIGIGIAVILMLTKRFWRGWIPLGK
jgi:hypothetical protein